MKIAVLGAGAMGSLFSAYLSRQNEVILIDVNTALIDQVRADGLSLLEPDGSSDVYRPTAACAGEPSAPVDLVILFVKAMYSEAALTQNRGLIGPDTYLLSLQNGSGHEQLLGRFVDEAHVVFGTTQHNASVVRPGVVRHGGSGVTCIGCPDGQCAHLQPIANAFSACGLACEVGSDVRRMIWGKLFTNVSASALTGVLQVPLGFIASDPAAWAACSQLIREAVAVADGLGMSFDLEEKLAEVKAVCERSPAGLTSIYADLRDGRRTEVDTISGSVVRAGESCGVPAPSHAMLVNLVHAMEARPRQTA